MSEDFTDSSAAISSSAPNWWDLHHASSWNISTSTSMWPQQNPNSNSPCEEDASLSASSFTNVSNHSVLTVESPTRLVDPASSNALVGEPPSDNHIWSQVLLSVGSNGEMSSDENLLNAVTSKGLSSGIFEPASDYLKKMDNNWEYSSSTSFSGYNNNSMIGGEKLTKLSNLMSSWSIAPPDPELSHQFDPRQRSISLGSSTNPYMQYSSICHAKQNFSEKIMPCSTETSIISGHDLKLESENHLEIEVPNKSLFRRSFGNYDCGYQFGLNSSRLRNQNGMYNYADITPSGSILSKPLADIHGSKPLLKSLKLSDCKRQGFQTTISSGRGHGSSKEAKKRRSEDDSETISKKSKHENNSIVPPSKASKVKTADKISALQQIVSPFGKTDIASVLQEAIGYIRFLQGQVQLLSNPYLKSNANKDPWGCLERKDEGDIKLDLKSKGLCLVPISCTPQVYRETTATDYWPTYRGCLYR